MNSNDTLATATDALRDAPVPPGPPADAVRLAERLAAAPAARSHWVTRLSWAAGVLAAVGVGGYLLTQRSATLVFADVVQSVRRTHTIEGTATMGPATQRIWVRGNQLRLDSKSTVQIVDLGTGDVLNLTPATHMAGLLHEKPMSFDVYGFFAGLHGENDGKPSGRRTIGGRRAEGFKVTGKIPGAPTFPLMVWVDPKTRLPVEIDANIGPMNAVLGDIQFDQPLDDRLFSLTPPEGYRLAESRVTRYAGRVTDGQGKPLSGVAVSLKIWDSYIHPGAGEPVTSDADGRFSISSQDPPEEPVLDDDLHAPKVSLEFRRSDLVYGRLEDLSLLSPEQRADLHVRLRHGARLSGKVVDPAGHPIAGVGVRAIFGLSKDNKDNQETRDQYYKMAVTDAAGHFELRGLPLLRAAIGAIQAGADGSIGCGQVNVDLAKPVKPVEITVRPLALPPGTAVHELLGMRLTDVTPALKSALLLGEPRGVLVLSPGPNARRIFNLGETLGPGGVIWMANDVHIDGYADLVRQLAAATAGQRAARAAWGGSQVVFDHTGDDGREYSITTYATLTADDMAEVARAAGALPK